MPRVPPHRGERDLDLAYLAQMLQDTAIMLDDTEARGGVVLTAEVKLKHPQLGTSTMKLRTSTIDGPVVVFP